MGGMHRLALLVAVHQPRQAHFSVARFAGVHVVLTEPGDALVVLAAAERGAEQPVTKRDRVMQRLAAGALAAVVEQIVVDADIRQVVEAERAVPREGRTALRAAGGFGAAVVEAQRRAQRAERARCPAVLEDQVAVAGACIGRRRGFDLDVGVGGRQALEVFQALLDVAQVEQVAGHGGDGVAQGGGRGVAIGRTDGRDAPRHQGECERAASQVLRGGEHAGGDPTRFDQRLLQPREHGVDALRAEATADGVVVALVTRGRTPGEQPPERLGALAVERQAVDAKARGFGVGQARDGGLGVAREARVDRALLLISQRTLALLLAQLFDEGLRGQGVGLCGCACGDQHQTGCEGNAGRRAEAPKR